LFELEIVVVALHQPCSSTRSLLNSCGSLPYLHNIDSTLIGHDANRMHIVNILEVATCNSIAKHNQQCGNCQSMSKDASMQTAAHHLFATSQR
jgi:tetrahydromethanopterin S-methyltransferase subunit A